MAGRATARKDALGETMAILGLRRVDDLLELAPIIRNGLPANAFTAVAAKLELSVQATAESLGLAKRTIARRIERKQPLAAEESERVVRLARVFAQAMTTLGSAEKARRWVQKPNRALGGEAPLRLLDTDIGAGAVLEELGRIEHGVFV